MKIRSLLQRQHFSQIMPTFFTDNEFRFAFWVLVSIFVKLTSIWSTTSALSNETTLSKKDRLASLLGRARDNYRMGQIFHIIPISANGSSVSCRSNNHKLKHICIVCRFFEDRVFLGGKPEFSGSMWLILQKWRHRVTRRIFLIIIHWFCSLSTDPLCQVKKSTSSKVNLSRISFIKGQLTSVTAKNNWWFRKEKMFAHVVKSEK